MQLKKTVTVIASIFLLTFAVNYAYAGWLDDVSKTVSNVNDIVNAKDVVKTTIQNILNSGNKFINREVEVSGKVTGMAVIGKNSYVIQLADSKKVIKCYLNKRPSFRLEEKITVKGVYDGNGIVDSIVLNNNLF